LPPLDFSGVAITDTSIRLTWTSITVIPSLQNGLSPLTNYEIKRTHGSDAPVFYAVSPHANFYVDTVNVLSGESYTYEILSINKYGKGDLSG